MKRPHWLLAIAAAIFLFAAGSPKPALANDAALIQVTIPAPNPVVEADEITFQILGLNTGNVPWAKGTYSWEVSIFDVDYNYLTKTDSLLPQDDVAPGGVSSAFVRFTVPEAWLGRRFYKVYLVHNGQRIVESDFQPFQVISRPSQAPPTPIPLEKYKLTGNMSFELKDSNPPSWQEPTGAVSANFVGKLNSSSFLFNSYFLSSSSRFINPVVLLFVYYAPWGTISAGDISPNVSPLSISGQGMRGAMLDQEASYLHWTMLGGQITTAEAGNLTTNGRYQRLEFGVKGEREVTANFKPYLDYTIGMDDTSSLSDDPNSARFRGPTLTPASDAVYGGGFTWNPAKRWTVLGDYQQSQFEQDATATSSPTAMGSAWRGEVRWETQEIKIRAWAQRAGTAFQAFGAPSVIPDRMTYDGTINVAVWKPWTLQANIDQYTTNLSHNSLLATTTQRTASAVNTFLLPTSTTLNVTTSLNTAQADPVSAQNTQTITAGMNAIQTFLGQSMTAGYQTSDFTDFNGLSHNLDTNTILFNASLNLLKRLTAALGGNVTNTQDKTDGSYRNSETVSASFGYSFIPKKLIAQLWGNSTTTKSDSALSPADSKTNAINLEWTYNTSPTASITIGTGYNVTSDAVTPTNDIKQTTGQIRYSYSF